MAGGGADSLAGAWSGGLTPGPLQALGLGGAAHTQGSASALGPALCPCLPPSPPKAPRAPGSLRRGLWEASPLAGHQLEMSPGLMESEWSLLGLDQPRLVRNVVLAHLAWLITQP